jgi:AcrR family transcriptional regulator
MTSRQAGDPERRRTGRRPGPTRTREQILAAARQSFARRGFDGTSLRAVAAKAGVDPALVRRFFGSKEDLLVAVLMHSLQHEQDLDANLEGDLETLGERHIASVLARFERRPNRELAIGVLRSALSNERAARLMRDYLSGEILERLGRKLDREEAKLRASLAGSQVIGLLIYRYVLKIQPLASASAETLTAIYGPTLQRYLTGKLEPPPPKTKRT